MTDAQIPYFDVPLDLPHAATVARRIRLLVVQRAEDGLAHYEPLIEPAAALEETLLPCRGEDDNPPPNEAEPLRQEAARQGRALVARIEALGAGEDRLGQCVRNLFECLEMGREGAALSLAAGENPRSLQRPA